MAAYRHVLVLKDDLPEFAEEMRDRIHDAVEEACRAVEAKAKMRSRVRTGALRASWHSLMEGHAVGVVYSDQEHSIYNEFGTRFMSAQPMLRPSVKEELPKMIDRLRGLGVR